MDQALLLWLNRDVGAPWLDQPMLLLSSVWAWSPVLVVLAVVLIWKYRGRGVLAVVAMALAVAIVDPLLGLGLKPLIARPRPCHDLADLLRLVEPCGGSYGFPSNHAANTAAMVAALGAAFPRSLNYGIPAAFAVGVSRVYLGAHYPTDVLAGFVIGGVAGLAVHAGLVRIQRIGRGQGA